VFDWWEKLSGDLTFGLLGFTKGSHLGEAVHFFLYDTLKIFILLVVIIFAVSFLENLFQY